jgi:hypothetical protein
MKRRTILVPFVFALLVPLGALDFGIGLVAVPGVAYGGVADPAFTGASAAFDVRFPYRAVSIRAGLESGISGIGAQLLAPLGAEFSVRDIGPCAFSAYASVIPGLAMFRPGPLFMWGAEIGSSCSWFWSAHWGLDVRLGVRYLTCPEYSARVSRYDVVDVPVSAAIRYRL